MITDFFGIGNSLKAIVRIYFHGSRRTGRTTSMIDSLKDGDRICFNNPTEAKRVSRLCKERHLSVECVVIPVDNPSKIFELGTSQGRTIFDHSWIEDYYMQSLERCGKDIHHFERESSGYGEAHRETRRKAEEISRWEGL